LVFPSSNDEFVKLYLSLSDGDIVKFKLNGSTLTWYGIIKLRETAIVDGSITYYHMHFDEWQSSRFVSSNLSGLYTVTSMNRYDGIFAGLQAMSEMVPGRITVTESPYPEDNAVELYSYPA